MDASSKPVPCRLSSAPLPHGYRRRTPERGDIAAVVALVRAEEIALSGESDVDEDELLAYWHLPRFDLERHAWLVEAPGGRAAGHGEVWDKRPNAELSGDFGVHPEEPHPKAVSAHLLAHVETRSRELSAGAGGARVLGVPADEGHEVKLELLARHGFAETRRFYRMRIDLRAGSGRPVWPAGIEVRAFRRHHDEAAVHQALQEAFAETFHFAPLTLEEWERHQFTRTNLDTGLWLVAWDGPEVAGVCLAFINPDRGYVDDLAVRKPWRGRGLGLALLLDSFALLGARGQTEVALDVDSENATGAVALYERAGMHVAVTQVFMEKRIGPGKDMGGLA